jgi:ATP-dependent helicase HrpB
VLAVKLQEMFGCTTTPVLGDGRIPLVIHLLSPARHPVQITSDLATFWKNIYPKVRGEMRGRYPKHPWPDNPLVALPTAKTNRALRRGP